MQPWALGLIKGLLLVGLQSQGGGVLLCQRTPNPPSLCKIAAPKTLACMVPNLGEIRGYAG